MLGAEWIGELRVLHVQPMLLGDRKEVLADRLRLAQHGGQLLREVVAHLPIAGVLARNPRRQPHHPGLVVGDARLALDGVEHVVVHLLEEGEVVVVAGGLRRGLHRVIPAVGQRLGAVTVGLHDELELAQAARHLAAGDGAGALELLRDRLDEAVEPEAVRRLALAQHVGHVHGFGLPLHLVPVAGATEFLLRLDEPTLVGGDVFGGLLAVCLADHLQRALHRNPGAVLLPRHREVGGAVDRLPVGERTDDLLELLCPGAEHGRGLARALGIGFGAEHSLLHGRHLAALRHVFGLDAIAQAAGLAVGGDRLGDLLELAGRRRPDLLHVGHGGEVLGLVPQHAQREEVHLLGVGCGEGGERSLHRLVLREGGERRRGRGILLDGLRDRARARLEVDGHLRHRLKVVEDAHVAVEHLLENLLVLLGDHGVRGQPFDGADGAGEPAGGEGGDGATLDAGGELAHQVLQLRAQVRLHVLGVAEPLLHLGGLLHLLHEGVAGLLRFLLVAD